MQHHAKAGERPQAALGELAQLRKPLGTLSRFCRCTRLSPALARLLVARTLRHALELLTRLGSGLVSAQEALQEAGPADGGPVGKVLKVLLLDLEGASRLQSMEPTNHIVVGHVARRLHILVRPLLKEAVVIALRAQRTVGRVDDVAPEAALEHGRTPLAPRCLRGEGTVGSLVACVSELEGNAREAPVPEVDAVHHGRGLRQAHGVVPVEYVAAVVVPVLVEGAEAFITQLLRFKGHSLQPRAHHVLEGIAVLHLKGRQVHEVSQGTLLAGEQAAQFLRAGGNVRRRALADHRVGPHLKEHFRALSAGELKIECDGQEQEMPRETLGGLLVDMEGEINLRALPSTRGSQGVQHVAHVSGAHEQGCHALGALRRGHGISHVV
mmetsp:Transcript_9160/g.27017  ORF Transcript_9160/g.27017 Transcript_9160/m.27017 type:complete len:382 (+) Transcript_9160:1104-2249(+)